MASAHFATPWDLVNVQSMDDKEIEDQKNTFSSHYDSYVDEYKFPRRPRGKPYRLFLCGDRICGYGSVDPFVYKDCGTVEEGEAAWLKAHTLIHGCGPFHVTGFKGFYKDTGYFKDGQAVSEEEEWAGLPTLFLSECPACAALVNGEGIVEKAWLLNPSSGLFHNVSPTFDDQRINSLF